MPPAKVLDQRDDADGHTHNDSDVHLGGHSTTVVVIVVTVHLLCGGQCECVWWAYGVNGAIIIIATIYFRISLYNNSISITIQWTCKQRIAIRVAMVKLSPIAGNFLELLVGRE